MNTQQVTAAFPHPTVTQIEGTPTYATIHSTHIELNANAASVTSTLGSGKHGLLGLTLTTEAYKAYNGTDWTEPPNPGATPAYTGLTDIVKVEKSSRVFEEKKIFWMEYTNTDKALKQQLLAAVDNIYLAPIKDRITGFNGCSSLDILSHLYTNYGKINTQTISEVQTQFYEPYNPQEPIEQLF